LEIFWAVAEVKLRISRPLQRCFVETIKIANEVGIFPYAEDLESIGIDKIQGI
jgi:hypothetical protein